MAEVRTRGTGAPRPGRAQGPVLPRVELYIPLILVAGISLAVLLYAQGMIGAGWSVSETKGSVVSAFTDTDTP
jgi:hypothetical protein